MIYILSIFGFIYILNRRKPLTYYISLSTMHLIMNQTVFEKLQSYLQEYNATFRVVDHPPAASALEYQQTLKTNLHQQLKALFVQFRKSEKDEFAICVVPADLKLDLDKVAQRLNVSNVRLGSRDDLMRLTQCAFGMLPPFGSVFSLPVVVDERSFDEVELAFNAGSLEKSIFIARDSYKRLVQDFVADIAKDTHQTHTRSDLI